jgi:two-component system chemotaxis response regulator CheY
MAMADMDIENGSVVTLSAVLDQSAADGLLLMLQAAVGTGGPVTIDASRVETMSLPCIQIVLSATRSGTEVTIANPSPVFADLFAGLGLNEGLTFSEMSDAAALEVAGVAAVEMPVDPVEELPQMQAAPVVEMPAIDDEPEAPVATGAAKRILTIDDSKTMRDMLMLTLAGSGYDVIQAVDGQDGLDVLLKEKSVDVIITDINMPKMDGYGVIQNVRANSDYDSTPILVLTTESDREKKERARELGATGFIVKPFNPATLVEVIRKVSP